VASIVSVEQRPFTELLADLADRTPAPGGGAAAAWTGAIAAALLEMAARFADEEAMAARGAELREQLLQAGQRDLESYVPVLAAFRRPREDPRRAEQLRVALQKASEAPQAMAAAAHEIAELAHLVATRSRPAVRGDALTAARLAEAAEQAARQLVQINHSLIERTSDST
jgi:formiminotetrahydrofolate cyclodeaminase